MFIKKNQKQQNKLKPENFIMFVDFYFTRPSALRNRNAGNWKVDLLGTDLSSEESKRADPEPSELS